jgi:tetratricopeptide (TPR) repeat protein
MTSNESNIEISPVIEDIIQDVYSESIKNDALKQKEEGNILFRQGNYNDALLKFNNAIELDPNNEVFYLNRSMCNATLHNWLLSIEDAILSIKINKKYTKAHYRLVKGVYLSIYLSIY